MLEALDTDAIVDDTEDTDAIEAMIDSEESVPFPPPPPSPSASIVRELMRHLEHSRPPASGVSGMKMMSNGRELAVRFPRQLTPMAETRRLAMQSRSTTNRVERVEQVQRGQQRRDTAVTGTVYIALELGLCILAIANRPQGLGFHAWAATSLAEAATLASAAQLLTTGAKWGVYRRYHRSRIGVVADAIALGEVALFCWGYARNRNPNPNPRNPNQPGQQNQGPAALQGFARRLLVLPANTRTALLNAIGAMAVNDQQTAIDTLNALPAPAQAAAAAAAVPGAGNAQNFVAFLNALQGADRTAFLQAMAA